MKRKRDNIRNQKFMESPNGYILLLNITINQLNEI